MEAARKRHSVSRSAALALVLGFVASPMAGEELVLKDGHKITGTIVGYENGMFRVETEFGFALVRKDKVALVNLSTGGPKDRGQERGEPKDAKAAKPAERVAEKASGSGAADAVARVGTPDPNPVTPSAEARNPAPKPAPIQPPAPPPSHPLDETLPAHLRDHLEGSNYVNDTFQFAMFKPPGWKIYEGAPKEIGYGIVAMGAEDEQTVLIVDRQVWSGAPDLKSDRAEEKLRQTYRDYKQLSESDAQLGGHPATRRLFKGVLDGVEWHGVSVRLARGNTVFGLIGLTSAETYQFQQAVISKIINSFHFLAPTTLPAPATAAGIAP